MTIDLDFLHNTLYNFSVVHEYMRSCIIIMYNTKNIITLLIVYHMKRGKIYRVLTKRRNTFELLYLYIDNQ